MPCPLPIVAVRLTLLSINRKELIRFISQITVDGKRNLVECFIGSKGQRRQGQGDVISIRYRWRKLCRLRSAHLP